MEEAELLACIIQPLVMGLRESVTYAAEQDAVFLSVLCAALGWQGLGWTRPQVVEAVRDLRVRVYGEAGNAPTPDEKAKYGKSTLTTFSSTVEKQEAGAP